MRHYASNADIIASQIVVVKKKAICLLANQVPHRKEAGDDSSPASVFKRTRGKCGAEWTNKTASPLPSRSVTSVLRLYLQATGATTMDKHPPKVPDANAPLRSKGAFYVRRSGDLYQ